MQNLSLNDAKTKKAQPNNPQPDYIQYRIDMFDKLKQKEDARIAGIIIAIFLKYSFKENRH